MFPVGSEPTHIPLLGQCLVTFGTSGFACILRFISTLLFLYQPICFQTNGAEDENAILEVVNVTFESQSEDLAKTISKDVIMDESITFKKTVLSSLDMCGLTYIMKHTEKRLTTLE